MKTEALRLLKSFETDLRSLRKNIGSLKCDRVGTLGLRRAAEELATRWVEDPSRLPHPNVVLFLC